MEGITFQMSTQGLLRAHSRVPCQGLPQPLLSFQALTTHPAWLPGWAAVSPLLCTKEDRRWRGLGVGAVQGIHGGCGWTAGSGSRQGASCWSTPWKCVVSCITSRCVSEAQATVGSAHVTPWSLSAEAIKWGSGICPKRWCRSHTSARLEVRTREGLASVPPIHLRQDLEAPSLVGLGGHIDTPPLATRPAAGRLPCDTLPHLPSHFCTPSG